MGSTVDVVCARLISVSGGVAVLPVLLVTSENSIFNFDLLDRRELQTWQGWRGYTWDRQDIGVRGVGVERQLAHTSDRIRQVIGPSCVTQDRGNYSVYIYKTEEPLCFTFSQGERQRQRRLG
jgi:hypothetical protein